MPLPTHYLITPKFDNETLFFTSLEAALISGTQLMSLTAKGLSETDYRALAAKVIPLAHQYDCQVLLSGDPKLVDELHADGLHLDSKSVCQYQQRPLAPYYLLAVSGHSLDALKAGEKIGASFAVLSPINATAAHPDIAPIGWEGMRDITGQLSIPVYAYGGVSADDEAAAKKAGGLGVAGNRGLARVTSSHNT